MTADPCQSQSPYHFEVGPIRPPSEARSLLLRVSRNCPWNKCTFCPVYKRRRFSRRSVDEVIADIEAMGRVRDRLQEISRAQGHQGRVVVPAVQALAGELGDHPGVGQLALWLLAGGQTAFLQDANSLLLKPPDLVRILEKLREVFPHLQRVTSYARSQTLARTPVEGLRRLAEAGLNRIHVGLESGSDAVLERVRKGATKAMHIEAGQRVRAAGIELSEYVMPGLGGAALWEEHADETADALCQINPHFIRLRTLGIRRGTGIRQAYEAGEFEPLDEDGVVREIRRFIQGLQGIESTVVSDHILNLLEEVEGTLPEDQPRMLALLDRYLNLPEDDRLAFQIGRRLGALRSLDELGQPGVAERLGPVVAQARAHPEGPQAMLRELITRFI